MLLASMMRMWCPERSMSACLPWSQWATSSCSINRLVTQQTHALAVGLRRTAFQHYVAQDAFFLQVPPSVATDARCCAALLNRVQVGIPALSGTELRLSAGADSHRACRPSCMHAFPCVYIVQLQASFRTPSSQHPVSTCSTYMLCDGRSFLRARMRSPCPSVILPL